MERGLFPAVPEHPCKCGHSYSCGAYSVACRNFNLHLEFPYGAVQLPRYVLQCPSGNPECNVDYHGTPDGLFLYSSTSGVALRHCYKGLDRFMAAGFSPASYAADVDRDYKAYMAGLAVDTLNPGPSNFISANTWRSAFYAFCMCISKSLNFCCPFCKNNPRCIIGDGTAQTINSRLFHGETFGVANPDFTVSFGGNGVRPTRDMRCFLRGHVRTAEDRKKIKTLLGALADHMKSVGSAKEVPFTTEQWDLLLPIAEDYWLKEFLEWIDSNYMGWLEHQRSAVAVFLSRILCTDTPTTNYFPYELVDPVSAAVNAEEGARVLKAEVLSQIAVAAPHLFMVLGIACGDSELVIDSKFRNLLDQLVQRTTACVTGPGGDDRPIISSPSEPSAMTSDCLMTGICMGYPKIFHRPKYPADGEADTPPTGCRHEFTSGNRRTGGVFTVFCEHGFCLGAFIMATAEGRNELFTFLTCYLETAPEVVVYDFACALEEYCLNRLPGYFKYTRFLIDRLHWKNHTACAMSYCMNAYVHLKDLNSVVAEQNNSALGRIERTITRSRQYPFMLLLRLFLNGWNQQKVELINQTVDYGISALEEFEEFDL